MQLALANAQSGLTPLERGKHALLATTLYGANGNDSIAQYAYRLLGKENAPEAEKKIARRHVSRQIGAYEVLDKCGDIAAPDKYFHHFVEIHAAHSEHWKELAERMIDEGWTVEQTRKEVQKLKPKKQAAAKPKPLIRRLSVGAVSGRRGSRRRRNGRGV